jgi:hypothetical protein
MEFICPECGSDVYWNPPPGQVQTSGWKRLCDDCLAAMVKLNAAH